MEYSKWLDIQGLTLADNSTNTLVNAANPAVFSIDSIGPTIIGPSDFFSSVYRLNLASGRADQLTSSGVSPSDFALLPSGQEALVAASGIFGNLGTLYRVNLTTQVTSVVNSVGVMGIAVEGNGSTALATIGNTLNRIDLGTGGVTPIAQGLNGAQGVAIEDSGTSALVASLSGIYRVNLTDGSILLLTNASAR